MVNYVQLKLIQALNVVEDKELVTAINNGQVSMPWVKGGHLFGLGAFGLR